MTNEYSYVTHKQCNNRAMITLCLGFHGGVHGRYHDLLSYYKEQSELKILNIAIIYTDIIIITFIVVIIMRVRCTNAKDTCQSGVICYAQHLSIDRFNVQCSHTIIRVQCSRSSSDLSCNTLATVIQFVSALVAFNVLRNWSV